MSLTSELESKNSWVNRFFKDHFAKVVDFTKREGPVVRALPTIVPTTSVGAGAMRLGTGFDHRLRLYLGAKPAHSSVIDGGIGLMQILSLDTLYASAGQTSNNLGRELTANERTAWADSLRALISEIPDQPENFLARISIILAEIDNGFRSGGSWSEGMAKVAREIAVRDEPSQWTDIVRYVSDEEATEIEALAELAKKTFDREKIGTPVFGPTFVGSSCVGGADADLIIDGCLYDVKTSINPRQKLPSTIRQILGYAVLDWDDEYAIERIGLYLSRQGKAISWSVDEIVESAASNPRITLDGLRREFRSCAQNE